MYIYIYINAIRKIMTPHLPHGSVATHALGHMMHSCNIVHHVPRCMSCHKAIVEITGRAHCFRDSIYISLVLLL